MPPDLKRELLKTDVAKNQPNQQLIRVAKFGDEANHAIVLLHGLNRSSYDFKVMMEALRHKFKKTQIIALTSRDKIASKHKNTTLSPSMRLPIKEQARQTYEEILQKIKKGTHVLLVGHSQGGLCAFTVLNEYGMQLKNAGIIVEGLATIGTPWKGVPVMKYLGHPEDLNESFAPLKATLRKINPIVDQKMKKHLVKAPFNETFPFLVKLSMASLALGASDLYMDSNFIKSYIAKELQTTTVPIMAIAGNQRDFSKIWANFPKKLKGGKELENLNNAYAKLIGGDSACKHDMLLPVSSQHAEEVKVNEGLFKRKIVDGACHGKKVGITVKKDKPELHHPQVIQEIVEFCEEVFYTKEIASKP